MRHDRKKQKRPSAPKNLAAVEGKLENVIESPFSRLFRSPLQPAEIEKAALKEVERTRKLGVNTIYVANVYTVVISPADAENLGDLIETLAGDLSTRIFAYTSNNSYQLNTRPVIEFLVDDDLKLGALHVIGETLSSEVVEEEFGEEYLFSYGPKASRPKSVAPEVIPPHVQTPAAPAVSPAVPPSFAANPLVGIIESPEAKVDAFSEYALEPQSAFKQSPPTPEEEFDVCSMAPEARKADIQYYIVVNKQPPLILGNQDRYVIGRKGDVDILLEDPQSSRYHAELIKTDTGWRITDLGSTNGTLLNNQPVSSVELRNGDVIVVGASQISYHEKRC